MTPDPTDAVAEKKPPSHQVVVTVNGKDVTLAEKRVTGREIKQAAIDQGVAIELDFELAEELPNGRERIVGDDDVITVTKKSTFIATAPDDNS